MKELEPKKQDIKHPSEERQVVKKLQHVSSIKMHRGHKFFQLCLATQEITEVEFDDVLVRYDESGNARKKVVIKPQHLYTSALNKKNAEKHFKNMILRSKGYPV